MDAVQRKLALLDRQLAGGIELYKQSLIKSPLLFCGASLIAGILLQDALAMPIWFWLVVLSLCAVTAAGLLVATKGPKSVGALACVAYLSFACLGAVRLAGFRQLQANDISNLVGDERTLATVRGVVISEPYVDDRTQWAFGRFVPVDPSSSFYLKSDAVQTPAGWAKVEGTVRVRVAEPVLDLEIGDYIQAYCWLSRFKGPANPGQFNVAEYLARKNIFVAASIKSRDGISILNRQSSVATRNNPASIFSRVRIKLTETATQALLDELSVQSQGLVEALLLGYRKNVDSDTYTAFRKTGLLHFISLSGLHVGILVGIIWWLCKHAGLPKPWRAVICIVWLGLFVMVVPPRAPILRAAIICSVFCISLIVRRRPDALNTLSLAAIILLLIRPTNLFEAGWQLSFATVLGILLFTDSIYFFIYEKTMNWRRIDKKQKLKPFFRIISRAGQYLLTLLSVGLAAWLGGAGILLYHFHYITPLSSIWTVAVFPLVAAILITGLLKIIMSLLVPGAALVFGPVVAGLSQSLIWLVKHIASLDISEILIGNTPGGLILGYYALILFVGFVYIRHPLLKKVIVGTGILVLVVFTGTIKWQRTHRQHLEMTCLSAGHGQAILVALPGGDNILFDAGSLTVNDCGRRIVLPFLNFSAIRTIDAIVISHNDVDHINAVPEITQDRTVNAVYANDAFISGADHWSTAKFMKDWLTKRGLRIEPVSESIGANSEAKVQMLWPSAEICENEKLRDNDKSQVVLIEFAGRKILLCSDIERFAQQKLVELYPQLKADIVVAPHHGSAKSLWPGFLRSIKPEILLFSCGTTQYKKHVFKPDENFESYYTARDGAIKICTEADGVVNIATYAN